MIYAFSPANVLAVCLARGADFSSNDLDHILIHLNGKESFLCGMNLHRMICFPFTSVNGVKRDLIFKPSTDFLKALRLSKARIVELDAESEEVYIIDRKGNCISEKYPCFRVVLGSFGSYPDVQAILDRADSCKSNKVDGIAMSGDDLAMLSRAYPDCYFSFRFSGSDGMIRVSAVHESITLPDRIVIMPIKEK